jgi:protein-tyrosine phosphatase
MKMDKSAITSSDHFESAGFVNLRDFGGRVLAGGYRIREGRLFRSGHFAGVSATDLRALGVRTAIDLREPAEIEIMPSAWDTNVVVLNPARDEAVGFNNREMLVWQPDMTLEAARRHRAQLYARMPSEFRTVMRIVFERLGDASSYPIVFHCMAGKDRTGFTAAVILTWLGVDRASVADDYMQSANAVRRFTPEQVQTLIRVYGIEGENADVFRAMTEVHTAFLHAALDAIEQQHGSVEAYLLEVVGLTKAQLDSARCLLVEPTEKT